MEKLVVARKWGNSVGVTIPPEMLAKEKIRPNDSVLVSVRKATTIDDVFGLIKSKRSIQEIKDEVKKGWG